MSQLPVGPYRDHIPARTGEDEVARAAIQREIERDERLLWAGRPAQGVRFEAADAFTIPFSLFWGGFAIYWEVTVILSGAPVFLVIWGIPFVAMGLYLIAGRFFVDARRRARTFYGLTDRRAIFVVAGASSRVSSIDLHGPEPVQLSEGRGGRGTIAFGGAQAGYGWKIFFGRMPLRTGWESDASPRFEGIADARAVYERLREAQRDLKAVDAAARLARKTARGRTAAGGRGSAAGRGGG